MKILKKILDFLDSNVEDPIKKRGYTYISHNKENDENFKIEFENNKNLEEIIEKVKKEIEEKEDKYKPKKEKPDYWKEKIYDEKYIKKEIKSNSNEIITDTKIINNKSKNNKKSNFYKLKQEWVKKGKEYEKFVGRYFEDQGYIIKYNGIEKGKKDNSIDIIAIKKEEIIFIQCKNWKENGKHKISHKDIKAFIGDTHIFINENPQYKEYKIKRLFVMSGKILDKSALSYINEHKDIIRYLLLKMEES